MPIDAVQPHVADLELEGKRYAVSCRIVFDGIEYVGRLWFHEEDWEEGEGLTDRGCIAGSSREEVVANAKRLSHADLTLRFRRALAEKRRYLGLRRVTDEILNKIRYLNQVAISMRAGLLDLEGAAQEIDLTEKQLHDCIDRLREYAGVES